MQHLPIQPNIYPQVPIPCPGLLQDFLVRCLGATQKAHPPSGCILRAWDICPLGLLIPDLGNGSIFYGLGVPKEALRLDTLVGEDPIEGTWFEVGSDSLENAICRKCDYPPAVPVRPKVVFFLWIFSLVIDPSLPLV